MIYLNVQIIPYLIPFHVSYHFLISYMIKLHKLVSLVYNYNRKGTIWSICILNYCYFLQLPGINFNLAADM